MGERIKTLLLLLLFSWGSGTLLSLFTFFGFPVSMLFSIGAIVLGVLFFRKFHKLGLRIAFVALALFFYFMGVLTMAVAEYARQQQDGAGASALLILQNII
ncbi:hypothetical protein [Paenibacillus methanolicus]|uniref:Uncharacterized protein n=1 Tax=Paenibacillus methanolicus TaxID=582686 RepID=A0A5S5C031_9BACL|nr:hypothetical protein [Paenibacillus methanolicus]TYP72654.1 hypothetical protein BCM02_108309 [Paenibacillus methanolicus]